MWVSQHTLELLQHRVLWVGSANSSTGSPGPSKDDSCGQFRDLGSQEKSSYAFLCFSSSVWSPCSPTQNLKRWGRAGDLSPVQDRLDLENLLAQHSASTALWPPSLRGKECVHHICPVTPPGHKPLSSPSPKPGAALPAAKLLAVTQLLLHSSCVRSWAPTPFQKGCI